MGTGDREIIRRLRQAASDPTEEFLAVALSRIGASSARPRRGVLLRAGVLLAATATAVGALASSGLFASQRPTPGALRNFVAAADTYPAPTVHCTLTPVDSGNHFAVTGTTTLPQGSISVTITASPADSNFPAPLGPVSVTSTTWDAGKTTGHVGPSSGHTYTATVTQTAAGYQNGTTTCTYVAL